MATLLRPVRDIGHALYLEHLAVMTLIMQPHWFIRWGAISMS